MPERLFVVVPSLSPTGPVKGAAALCNALVERLPVTLVVLKHNDHRAPSLDPRIDRLELFRERGWWSKSRRLAQALRAAGGRSRVACLSMCLSADAVNFWMRRHAFIASSVRGNLPMNYRFDYGPIGVPIAWMHLAALRRFDLVTAMSDAMLSQLQRFGLRRAQVIGNFIDELALAPLRCDAPPAASQPRLVFVGSLTARKRPNLLLQTTAVLHRRGLAVHVDIIGSGTMDRELRQQAAALGIADSVTFHGQLDEPFAILQQADCLLLPSESEGISRAVMEALYFGIPCILRDVDGHRELISPGINGELFANDDVLPDVVERFFTDRDRYLPRRVLLPDTFRQRSNADLLLERLPS